MATPTSGFASALSRVQELRLNSQRLFSYPIESGGSTEFFVQREADNSIIVAFASCRKCYLSGHYRQGDQIVCGRCSGPMTRVPPGQTISAESECDNRGTDSDPVRKVR